jgi:two-component system response regulator PhoP
MRILLVEDHAPIAQSIATILTRRNYAIVTAMNGATALSYLREEFFDLAIVDIGLPDIDGFQICTIARQEHINCPILILTARESVEDRVRGLDAGADDYLMKPFHEEELAARLRTLARRAEQPIQDQQRYGNFTLDRSARRVVCKAGMVPLASTEFRIVELLVANCGMVLTRDKLLDRVWGAAFDGDPNIVDVYMSSIRRKFRSQGVKFSLATVRGLGYRFDA